MSRDQAPPNSTIDPYECLQIIPNPDGTIKRLPLFPTNPAAPNPDPLSPIITKDVPLNPTQNTFLRIFLPRKAQDNSSTTTKLPLIVYFHGGGFILLSVSSSVNHDFCTQLALNLAAVVVSVEYRLAPEHRLPAAYDDAVEALRWFKGGHAGWLSEFADFSTCFLMGTSAGGNIAYHAGLRAITAVDELEPLKIRGLILHQPYFSGSQRTGTEIRLVNDIVLPLCVNDLMWELALPIGADRDHEYCNPMAGDGFDRWEQITDMGWGILVTGCDGDPMIGRHMELVEMLKRKGVQVVAKFGEGDYHGVELFDQTKAQALFATIKEFIGQ